MFTWYMDKDLKGKMQYDVKASREFYGTQY